MQPSYIDKLKNLEFDQHLQIATGISRKDFQLIKNGELYLSDSKQYRLDKYFDIHQEKETKTNTQIEKGKDAKISQIVLSVLAIVIISLLFTGFGYQPWWLFIITLILGLVVTLPACYSNYFWSMNYDQIILVSYNQNDFKKLLQILKIKKKKQRRINYEQIKNVEVVYTKIVRISPFNFNPDCLYLSLNLKNRKLQ